jgi:hypothetical protein
VSSCFGDIKLEEKQEHKQDDEVETPCASNCLGHTKLEEEEEEEEEEDDNDDDDDVETPCVSSCLGDGKLEEEEEEEEEDDDDDVMKTPSVSSTFRI